MHFAIVIVLLGACIISNGLPVLDTSESDEKDSRSSELKVKGLSDSSSSESGESPEVNTTVHINGTTKDLYVIKAVVYEIGILTDSSDEDNSTSLEETHERVDLTFFDAHQNSSHIDLGKVPLPVQTNISGQVLTGIAPIDIGAFSNPSELFQSLPLTGTIVNITHSDTGYFQLTTSNQTDKEKDSHVLNLNDLTKIPELAGSLPDILASLNQTEGNTENLV